MTEKTKRLEAANQARAEAAVRWERSDDRAGETGRVSDKIKAAEDDRILTAADRRIKSIEPEPQATAAFPDGPLPNRESRAVRDRSQRSGGRMRRDGTKDSREDGQ